MKHFALFRINFDPLGMTRIDIEEYINVIFKIVPPCFDKEIPRITKPFSGQPARQLGSVWPAPKYLTTDFVMNVVYGATKFGAKINLLNYVFKHLNKNSFGKTQKFCFIFFLFQMDPF